MVIRFPQGFEEGGIFTDNAHLPANIKDHPLDIGFGVVQVVYRLGDLRKLLLCDVDLTNRAFALRDELGWIRLQDSGRYLSAGCK